MSQSVDLLFVRFSRWTSKMLGSSYSTAVAVLLVVLWLATGPAMHWDTAWSFIGNDFTTVVTFLMTFVILAAQNREVAELKLQVSELTRAIPQARSELAAVEDKPTEEIERLQHEIAEEAIKEPPTDEPTTWLG